MLQNFRDNLKGVTAFILVAILAVPLVLLGVDSLFVQGSAVEKAAKVNGEGISELRLSQAIESRKNAILSQYQNIDPKLISDEQLREPVLQGLITQLALAQKALEAGMGVAEDSFRDLILGVEAFQRDGRFDRALYEFNLNQMGYTTKTYRERVEQEMLVNQFVTGVLGSSFVTEEDLGQYASVALQARDFYYLTVPLADYLNSVSIEDSEVQAFYEENPDRFRVDEQVVIEYIELSAEDLVDQVTVNDDMLADFARQRAEQQQQQSSWSIAHILVEDSDSGQQVLDEIRSKLEAGESFDELAATYSQDFGSAEQGGRLGVFTAGSFPENFEEAVTTLETGDVSEPVRTSSGLHLIKLLDRSEPEAATAEVDTEALRDELALQLAAGELPGEVELLKEKSYNAETLATVAADLSLALGISEPFSRDGGDGIAANPVVVNTAFSDDVLTSGYASEVIELEEGRYLVMKLKEHIPAHRQDLAAVEPQIRAELKRSKAAREAMAYAESLKTRIAGGESVEEVAVAEELDWQVALETTRFDGGRDPRLVDAVFGVSPEAELPRTGTLAVTGGDVVVYSLTRIQPGDVQSLEANRREALQNSLLDLVSSREWQAYQEALMADVKVVR